LFSLKIISSDIMVGGYKRPSVEKSATPSKRAKTSMRGITPVKDHGVGFGCVPADPEFIDTRDNDLPDGLSLLNFVNVKAAKLYESVAVLRLSFLAINS
jgi:hypothetical protein